MSDQAEPGSRRGEYELLEKLGRGGMGEVWKARHVESGELAAVKLLFPRPDRKEEAQKRFAREVEAAGRIGHPGIVRVRGFGAGEDGSMFIVMELLEGAHLRAWLARSETSLLAALRSIRELLDALAAAHACTDEGGNAAPIIHRDLKPENVFVIAGANDGERVKLLDFGIARQQGSAHVTDTGVGMGTAAYMSPEQATDARDVGPASDVWSVGVMLYEILSGKLPFDAPSKNEIISKILTRDPMPLRDVAPNVPRRLARLVASCLAKDPARRPRDATALAAELDAILGDEEISGALGSMSCPHDAALAPTLSDRPIDPSTRRSAPPRRARGLLWIAIVGALLASTALAAAFWPRETPRPPRRPIAIAAVPDAGSPPLELNVWIAVEGARDLVLGLDASSLAANESAFHRAANARAPAQRYEIQQHEVTWGELEPWLDAHGETLPLLGEERPAWLPPSAGERARFPATGIAWRIAHAYCRSIGGSLPSEEEWELAARGPSLSRYAWGDALADSERTNIGPRAGAHPLPVMSHDQDRTPGPSDRAIWDLMGNAREWTRDLWRDNADLSTPEFVQAAGLTFRAVRGLPLASASRWLPPEAAPAAHRIPLCATGACPEGTDAIRMDVGFRCARESR